MGAFRTKGRGFPTLAIVSLLAVGGTVHAEESSVKIFERTPVYFSTDSGGQPNDAVQHEDNGRVAVRTVTLPQLGSSLRITALLTIHPLPKDEVSVFDPWDRAGDIRLATESGIDIELVKFVTAYGGRTDYEIDISQLCPLFNGTCTVKAFIDTWLNPAWEIDFALRIVEDTSIQSPDWAAPVFFDLSFDRSQADTGGVTGVITVPGGLQRVRLYYFVSGHCTDGRGADEFEPKDNVLFVDGTAVYRYQPWRDDCRNFRQVNPYTRRWSDGTWSSDYSRSGWCPGDVILPLVLDLSDHLTPGEHMIRGMVEDIRPKGDDDHYGYWRVSAYVVGWKEK